MTDWVTFLEETVKECATLTWMAYYGNADERVALQSIRRKLDELVKHMEAREADA